MNAAPFKFLDEQQATVSKKESSPPSDTDEASDDDGNEVASSVRVFLLFLFLSSFIRYGNSSRVPVLLPHFPVKSQNVVHPMPFRPPTPLNAVKMLFQMAMGAFNSLPLYGNGDQPQPKYPILLSAWTNWLAFLRPI